MRQYLEQAKEWYNARPFREQLLVFILSWALLYAFFSLFFFHSLEYQQALLQAEIKETKLQLQSWQTQITALHNLSRTPLFKKWLEQRNSFTNLEKQYKYMLKTSSSKQWQDVIKTLLQSQKNITLLQIKNDAETVYNQTNINNVSMTIYQQPLTLSVYSDYFTTINYLSQLETMLPNIHWDKLNYQVVQYPIAKIDMEFSILYDKTT